MRFKSVAAITAATLLTALAQPVAAQVLSCTGNGCFTSNTGTLTVGDVMQLDLSSVSTNLGTPVLADFNAGSILSTGPTATVWSNRAYRVTVDAPSDFVYTGSLAGTKVKGDLQWKTTGAFASLTTSAADAYAGTSHNGTASAAIQYKTLLAYANDKPGSYALLVKFTLTAP